MIQAEQKWPRSLATLVLGFFLAVLSSTLFAWLSVGPIRLEPTIVLVVAAGYRLPLVLGFLVVWALAYMADLLGGGLMGLNLVSFSLVFVVCALAQLKLNIDSWPFQMLSVGVMSLFHHLMVAGGLFLASPYFALPAHWPLVLVAQAVLNALTAPLFFGLLEGLVRLLARLWPHERKVIP